MKYLPKLSEPGEKFILDRQQYSYLLGILNGYELQRNAFLELSNEIVPTKDDLNLP